MFHGVLGPEGSFLYSGCYRARGGLSVAQRAAWGLHVGCGPALRSQPLQGVAPVVRRPPCACEDAFTTRVKRGLRSVAVQPAIRWKNKRLGFACGLPRVERQTRPVLQLRQPRGPGADRAIPYRRMCVAANGQHLTCTVFRGRAYVVGILPVKSSST